MKPVNVKELMIGRIMLVVVFAIAFLSTGLSKYIGGQSLAFGIIPGFYIIVLINIILIFISVGYYNAKFVPDELFDEQEDHA